LVAKQRKRKYSSLKLPALTGQQGGNQEKLGEKRMNKDK
jgi:hypothetical protein